MATTTLEEEQTMEQSTNGTVEATMTQPPTATKPGVALELHRRGSGLPSSTEVDELAKLANILAKSGFFKDVTGGYQAFAKLLFGRDLGLSATAALTGVNLVEGKPELSANVQAQMVRSYIGVGGERYDYKIVSPIGERAERCEIEFYRVAGGRRELLGTSEFTMTDAERAGLTKPSRSGKPSNYLKYPANMLFARAMSNGVAFHCPEVTGGIRVYHAGEIEQPTTTVPDGAEPYEVEEIPVAEIVDGAPMAEQASGTGEQTQTEPDNEGPVGDDTTRRTQEGHDTGTNPHGQRVRRTAAGRGIGGAALANLMLEAAGAKPLPASRAQAQLDAMLERVPEPVADATLALIDERYPAEPDDASDSASGAVAGEDFARFEPPQAA
jgi:hypothetical protein